MKCWMLGLFLYFLMFTAQGEMPMLLPMIAVEQSYTTDPDESLVYVSGKVRTLPASATGSHGEQPSLMRSNFTVIGSQSTFDTSGLLPAAGVEVRFWQPDQPGVFFKAQTDEAGNYVIGLGEGQWMGEACGSASSFYPAAWQLTIVDEVLQTMQAVPQKVIELSATINQYPAGSEVTLNGRGFGCSGRLVFHYSNPVDRCGYGQAVEYDHELITVSDFIARSDTQLRFTLPPLAEDRTVGKHIANVYYQQGSVRSRAVAIGEVVRVPTQLSSATCQAMNAGGVPGVNVVTGIDETPLVVFEDETTPGQNVTPIDSNTLLVARDLGSEPFFKGSVKTGFKIKVDALLIKTGGGR